MQVLTALRHSFHPGRQRLLVAFSGGPDSLCLLWGLTRIASELRLNIEAVHLDHGLDSDSARRADAAAALARELGTEMISVRLSETPPAGESVEAWARNQRYRQLDRIAVERSADTIVTAHHADDQAETVLLRMLYGSGLEGLAAIRPTAFPQGRTPVVRPLLGLRRRVLLEALADTGLAPLSDPTNTDLRVPRNRVRTQLLPRLSAAEPLLVERLNALAAAAGATNQRCEELLRTTLALRSVPDENPAVGGAEIDRQALESLPEPLFVPALAALGRQAGARYPAGEPARRELLRQLRHSPRIGCDCGDGWRWEGDRQVLRLVPSKPKTANFAYTLSVPGEVGIPELGLRTRLRRGRVASWMFHGRVDRTGLAADLSAENRVVIRNRRPGDRVRPLGRTRSLRLKDLLIARKIPRDQRDRLPLMEIDGRIVWIPGVTIDDRYRLRDEETAWIAEIEPLNEPTAEPRLHGS